MTLAELIANYRIMANDKVAPYFVDDAEVTVFFNEAQEQAAIRGRLLHESDSSAMCEIKVKQGRATNPINALMYEITHARWHANGVTSYAPLEIVSTEALDATYPRWRVDSQGLPRFIIQGDNTIRLYPAPSTDGIVFIEAYRLPKNKLEGGDDELEINKAHHNALIEWALYKTFSIPDSEIFDPNKAAVSLEKFNRYFGLSVDCDLRRTTRHDVVQHVQPFFV